MIESEILKYINFCKKSSSIVYGIDAIKQCKQKIYLILIDENAGVALKKSVYNLKNYSNSVLEVSNLDGLLSTSNCKAAAFLNQSLANTIKSKF